jgi:hypothetical protein
VADAAADRRWTWSLSPHVEAIPGASLAFGDTAAVPDKLDVTVVQSRPRLLQYSSTLDRLASAAGAVTMISYGDRSMPRGRAFLTQWGELRWAKRWLGRLGRVAYKDGFCRRDLWGLMRPRCVVGFDVHSKFLQDEALFHAIHAADWEVSTRRPYRANFLGSRDPLVRGRILDTVEPFFLEPVSGRANPRMPSSYWHPYSDAQPAALSPQAFLEILTKSDFTLCPPGYSRVTHRPVEALLRGSIPVINADELDLYDLGLVDGLNAIAVPLGKWAATMERIAQMSEAEVVNMRRNIQAMLPATVMYPALARDMSRRLGVT